MRGWGKSTRLVEGDLKMGAPDRGVAGIAGGDPKTAAASAGEDEVDADESRSPGLIPSTDRCRTRWRSCWACRGSKGRHGTTVNRRQWRRTPRRS